MPDLDQDARTDIARLSEIQADIAQLSLEADEIKSRLRDLDPGDHMLDGRPALRIRPSRRFDVDAAARAIPDDHTRQACLTVGYDPAKVKQHLTPDQLEHFMVEHGKPKVTLL